MVTNIDGLRVQPYEVSVTVNDAPYKDRYFAELAVQILNRCGTHGYEKIYFVNFVSDTGRMKTSYRVIGMKYLAPCQIGHCRLYNAYGTALQARDYRQQVALEWYDQLSRDKAFIENLDDENKNDILNMLKAYIRHVQTEKASLFINYLLDTSDLAVLKEIGLAFIRFLRYTVKIE